MFVKYKILPYTKLNLEKLFKTFKISPEFRGCWRNERRETIDKFISDYR